MSLPVKPRRTAEYQRFNPIESAKLSLHYLTNMTDPMLGHLPY